jgi:calcineurin-like phosphoesterase family protein/Kazal-type serine protease inhibitor-like protein
MKSCFIVILGMCLGIPAVVLAGIAKGPYLQDVRKDRITIVCETDSSDSCTVFWGDGLANSESLSASGVHHEGTISGLSPSTCYPYQVTCTGESKPEASFCTAPEPGEPFSFVLFGDTRSNHADHQTVIDQIRTEGVDFVINTGDLVSSGEIEDDWVHFFEVEDELLHVTPMYPVVGNHEDDDGNIDIYERLFALPSDSSGKESYYSFSYGNAYFIVIDNQSSVLWAWFLDLTQKNWALAEMDAANANPDIDHIFVLAHANIYSSKDGRTGDMVLRGMRNDMLAKGVKAVFSGHDHHYVRGEADNGLMYITAGGGGAGLYDTKDETEGDPIEIALPAHTVYYSKAIHHYLRIDIDGSYFSACAKDSSGVAFDCFSYGQQPQDGGIDGGQDAGADPGYDGGVDAGPDASDDGGLPADDGGCDCSGEPYEPVCGEDEVTYDNMCELDCAQVGMDHMGECGQNPNCEADCPDIDQQVCAKDGTTYRNMCFLECAKAEFDYEGECVDPCADCPATSDPVCGQDGITYANLCLMECVGVTKDHDGECQEQIDCNSCPSDDQPVCGQDDNTYKNQCLMECMGVEAAYLGKCKTGSSCACRAGQSGSVGILTMLYFALVCLAAVRRRKKAGRAS